MSKLEHPNYASKQDALKGPLGRFTFPPTANEILVPNVNTEMMCLKLGTSDTLSSPPPFTTSKRSKWRNSYPNYWAGHQLSTGYQTRPVSAPRPDNLTSKTYHRGRGKWKCTGKHAFAVASPWCLRPHCPRHHVSVQQAPHAKNLYTHFSCALGS